MIARKLLTGSELSISIRMLLAKHDGQISSKTEQIVKFQSACFLRSMMKVKSLRTIRQSISIRMLLAKHDLETDTALMCWILISIRMLLAKHDTNPWKKETYNLTISIRMLLAKHDRISRQIMIRRVGISIRMLLAKHDRRLGNHAADKCNFNPHASCEA